MAGLRPTPRTMSDIKSKLLRPATTSHFECFFAPPKAVKNAMKEKNKAGAGVDYSGEVQDLINISCFDASLPGSSFQTANLTDSYTGVNETYAYRRAYDNRADFSFYVDHNDGKNNYQVILFFENWMSFIADEQFTENNNGVKLDAPNYFYRLNYPDDYASSNISITKFEKDYKGRGLRYDFLYAYPISIASMPVSYDASQVLKCTVSFNYQRYTVQGA